MKIVNKIDEAKVVGAYLLEIANEVQNIISNEEERDNFAMGFIQYVENTYVKKDNVYYYKNPLISGIHRNLNEVLDNYKHFLRKT